MIKTLTKSLTITFVLFSSMFMYSQNATVNGVILEESNVSIPFVNVAYTIDGNLKGTTSDLDGKYSISLPAGSHELTFSFTGFQSQTQSITVSKGETLNLDITLSEVASLLDEITVTADKYEKSIGKVTASLEVVGTRLIEQAGNVTLDQSIEKVPGVNVVDGQANIRGGSGYSYGAGSRVLLLYDDMPIASGDAGFPDWDYIPLEITEQVEVIKGAASTLYGSSALNGVINVRPAYAKSEPLTNFSFVTGIYQNPRDRFDIDFDVRPNGREEANGTTRFEQNSAGNVIFNDTSEVNNIEARSKRKDWWNNLGSFELPATGATANDSSFLDSKNRRKNFWGDSYQPGFSQVAASHRRKIKQWDLVAGGNLYTRNTWRQGNYQRRARFNVGVRHRFKKFEGLSAGININSQFSNTGTFFLWQGDGNEAYVPWEEITPVTNDRVMYNIDPFVKYIGKNETTHQLRARYVKRDNITQTNQSIKSDQIYAEYQFYKRFVNFGANFTGGVVYQWAETDAELYDGNYFSNNAGFYAQFEKDFLEERLNLIAGARYEINRIGEVDSSNISEIDGSALDKWEAKPVFRIGANYELIKNTTFLRASFGQGYRFPTIAEKYVRTDLGGVQIAGNPDLESETGWSSEIGIKQGLKVGKWLGYADAAYFWTEYQNMMEFGFGSTPDGPGFITSNEGDTQISGFEVSLAGKGDLGPVEMGILAGYTYIDPEYKDFSLDYQTDRDGNLVLDENGEKIIIGNNAGSSDFTNNVLKYRFRHTFKSDVQLKYKKVSLGGSYQFNSFMEAIDDLFISSLPLEIGEYRAENNKGEGVLDARIMFDVTDNYSLTFIVNNVLNNEYTIRPALIEPPRHFTLKFSAKL